MSIAASASSHACISSIPTCIPSSSSKFSSSLTLSSLQRGSNKRSGCRAMVQQAVQGAPAAYAKEMERLSAKESLLLAFKDAGGFEALVSGKTTEWQKIDVNERITGLERLNPTPRPTTSPFLEGQWNFEWFGSGSPGLFAARFIFEIFPSTLANLSKMDVVIKDGNAKITANMRLLNSIENKVILSTKLSVEGPLRMKEEYVEGVLVTPTIIEERVPEQLKGALGQAANALQQLPTPIWDPVASGLKVPLNNKEHSRDSRSFNEVGCSTIFLGRFKSRV
ncbi:probable plastid-lipid-associated protein 13, chloroplastic isoform X2 [Glycine soja]|uniref:probable plastid-lipid-associated protein 13, chloroplastic isoform X2 n=1 Tax=Glycine soja TaxID=3848 RepID=UPI0007193711|nr:probable plastid-lipid-associated protein 13, chloroplastic isoform X2 [Glycine soja]|eukprot:XP_014623365.1 probable plastid-lipid-associated protein 13, chloroplastic isoform X2 [Glycine max]